MATNYGEYTGFVKSIIALVEACKENDVWAPDNIRFDKFIYAEIFYHDEVDRLSVEMVRIYDGFKRGINGDSITDITI